MRSRLAIITMLVLGFAFSGAGVGLAVNGVGTAGTSAADQQYDRPAGEEDEKPTLRPQQPTDQVEDDVDVVEDEGDAVAGDVQENQQVGVANGGQELPFTGFAAIPVLLVGLALLSAGFVLRRRSGGSDES